MLERQLDHVLSLETNAPPSIFYTDVTGPAFAHFHKILSKSAKEGKTSYRVRYIRSGSILSKPLIVNGYGVELALKRTDYIVIDDRDANPATKSQDLSSTESATRKQQSDLRPLSTSELSELGLKTASMILSSSGPMEALLQISQDFPKHSAEIASQNTSFDLLEEIKDRADVLPGGYSGFWMNGIPLDARQVEAYAILHHMRREMRLIGGLKGFGLSGSEAIKLISHSAISNSKANNELQRYDYRDNIEGGGVIIWLNDLEKDQRYNRWPSAINAVRHSIDSCWRLLDLCSSSSKEVILGSCPASDEMYTTLLCQLILPTQKMWRWWSNSSSASYNVQYQSDLDSCLFWNPLELSSKPASPTIYYKNMDSGL